MTVGRRGGTAEQGRRKRQEGHDAAYLFALCLGLEKDYRRDPQAKKDVIDPAGDAHSVKAGDKKWQIFLYRRNRFLEDDSFQALNGVGDLLVRCIDAFPPNYQDYQSNKAEAKERLQIPMRELKDRLQRKILLRAFLKKAFFNAGEVDYLTILDDDKFHVYWSDDVVRIMADAFSVENSKARQPNQFDDQKVLFKHNGYNVGELEMRNDSEQHYREIRFNTIKPRFMDLMNEAKLEKYNFSDEIVVYCSAIRKFGIW